MHVINFLAAQPSITDGLAELQNQLGIKAKIYEDEDLIVLNYSQIDSPKTDPIVTECRGLIIDSDLNIVCRPMDRFFNLGEALNVMPELDWANASIYEKVDGSLIKIYFDGRRWQAATRGTAFAESDCMGHGITFRELVFKAMSDAVYGIDGLVDETVFQQLCENNLSKSISYMCELTCVENRVVKHYHGYRLHFLTARNTETGEYLSYVDGLSDTFGIGSVPIKSYFLRSAEEAIEAARVLKDLDEGFIVYQNGIPVAKIKSPAYVAVHHIRGEGLNPKRISQLVVSGEEEEYLTYFPEDRPTIQPYADALESFLSVGESTFQRLNQAEDQKQFAQAIQHCGIDKSAASVYFTARRDGKSFTEAYHSMKETYKVEILRKWMNW